METLTPLNASLIVDNLTYFQEKYESGNSKQNFKNFQIACFCGSENIANFYLENLRLNRHITIY